MCWDEDIVPAVIAEVIRTLMSFWIIVTDSLRQSYTYPPGKDRSVPEVSRADMANYFASYNTCVHFPSP